MELGEERQQILFGVLVVVVVLKDKSEGGVGTYILSESLTPMKKERLRQQYINTQKPTRMGMTPKKKMYMNR